MDSFKISKERYFDLMKLDRVNAVNLFLYLLANADDNGTLIVSIRKISSELDIGLRTVRTILKKLYSTNIVTHQVTHKGSSITINNIDCYKIQRTAVIAQTGSIEAIHCTFAFITFLSSLKLNLSFAQPPSGRLIF